MTSVTLNGNTYTDDANPTTGLGNNGHRTRFLPLVADILTVASAMLAVPSAMATSGSTLTVGTGSKSLTIETGKNISSGMSVKVSSTADPTVWMHGDVTAYTSGTGALTVNVTNTQGTGTAGSWAVSLSAPITQPGLVYAALTGAATLEVADRAKFVDVLSGTFTLAFAACAALGANWITVVRNNGSGDVTLDPSGAETIDGMTSYIMYPGEARLIQCDGAVLRSVVLAPFHKAFSTAGSASFVKPPGYARFGGRVISGGASGGRFSTGAYGGPGGGAAPFDMPASVLSASTTVVVGAGGAALTTTTSQYGNPGADSSFGSLTVKGGGTSNSVYGGSLLGRTASNPIGFEGSTGTNPAIWGGGGVASGADGGSSLYGAPGGGSVNGTTPHAGGTNAEGSVGGTANDTSAGTMGTGPGAGGGATRTGASSGAGQPGQVSVWGIA